MSETPLSAAEQLRAEEADIARRKAENDQPLLQRASDLLAGMAAATQELSDLAPNLLVPWVAPQLTALVMDYGRAVEAVAAAITGVNEVMGEDA